GGSPTRPGRAFYTQLAQFDLPQAILATPPAAGKLSSPCRQNYAALAILADPTAATVNRLAPLVVEVLEADPGGEPFLSRIA
ncbi:MAG: hypothetical protein GWO24_28985, partial [Akkermansiaceae bacterium]|nr:hypothetical protein [Akkermansiaceae bacterium]